MSPKFRQLLTPLALPVVMTTLSIVVASFTGQPVQSAASSEAPGTTQAKASKSDAASSKSSRGYLGVSCQRLRGNLREVLEVPDEIQGVLISDVVDGSPADRAGLRNRDIVLKMDGQTVDDEQEFTSMIRKAGAGKDITLTIWRAGSSLDLHPTLKSAPAEHRDYSWSWSSDDDQDGPARRHQGWAYDMDTPPPPPRTPRAPRAPMEMRVPDLPEMPDLSGLAELDWAFAASRGRLGVQLQELTPEIAPFFNAPNDKGVLIWKVMEDSPAEKAGFKPGDVIVEVEGQKVEDTGDLHEALGDSDGGDKVAVTVLRRGQSQTLTPTLDEGNLRFSRGPGQPNVIRIPRGGTWTHRGEGPGGEEVGPPMERLRNQMERLQQQMDRLKEQLDRLKD